MSTLSIKVSRPTHPLLESVTALFPDSNQIVVYGATQCKYADVRRIITSEIGMSRESAIKKVFDYTMGDFSEHGEATTTLEGHKLNLLAYQEGNLIQRISRPSKTGPTNLVLQNYFRQIAGLPMIPLIFCYDIDDNPEPFDLKKITSKLPDHNKQHRYKELRRMWKLCYDPTIDPEIRAIAQHTFRFVKVKRSKEGEIYGLEMISSSPLDAPELVQYWKERKKLSTARPKSNHYDWRKQTATILHDYRYLQGILPPKDVSDEKKSLSKSRPIKVAPLEFKADSSKKKTCLSRLCCFRKR